MRPSGRAPDALRDVSFTTGFAHHAEGSCLIRMGGTEVLCTASPSRAGFRVSCAVKGLGLDHGRVRHAAPRHPHARRPGGGARQAIRPHAGDPAPDRPQRCAPSSIARRWGRCTDDARLRRAERRWRYALREHHGRLGRDDAGVPNNLEANRVIAEVAASPGRSRPSVVRAGRRRRGARSGLRRGLADADADANFVLTEGGIVEIQGTAEKTPFSDAQFAELMALARHGTAQLYTMQRAALG